MDQIVLASDIHGNAPALDAVISAEGEDVEYVVLGDLLGLLPFPARVVDLLQSVDSTAVAGNHDAAIVRHDDEGHVSDDALSRFESRHTLRQLSEEQTRYVEQLDHMEIMVREDDRICATHAFPWPEQASGYEPGNAGVRKRDLPSVASTVADDYSWVFHGHTHEQYDMDCSKWGHDVHFVNPGSLGYDSTYSVVDLSSGEVHHKTVDYDKDIVRERLAECLPSDAPSSDKWLSLG